jgi:hypothetical protein
VEQITNTSCNGNGCTRIMRDGHSHLVYGNDCNNSGPFGSYHWSLTGNELTLKPIHEGCPDRRKILTGTWTQAH